MSIEIMDDFVAFDYLFKHLEYYIDDLINHVMEDSETDPHYSAVTAYNLIVCYTQIKRKLDPTYSVSNVKEYIQSDRYYTEEDYNKFEEKRKKESTYYIGEQFTEAP